VVFLAGAGIGLWQLTRLPIDAVPDITTKQVQISTVNPASRRSRWKKLVLSESKPRRWPVSPVWKRPGRSRATGSARLQRSSPDSTDLSLRHRQQVGERLTQAGEKLPAGVQPRSVR
jgi:cobalt-zinc-cadmium resistance protein CzcA